MWGSLLDGFKVLIFTTENTVKSFISQMASLSLDVSDYLLMRKLKVYHIQAKKIGWSPQRVFETLIKETRDSQDTDLIIIDSLTGFVTRTSEEHTIEFFEECKTLCDEEGKSIVNIVHSYAFNDTTLIRVRSMCDAHLKLRIEEIGDQLIKSLEVAKVRGADRTTGNIISFDVEPGMGMRIIPISKAKA